MIPVFRPAMSRWGLMLVHLLFLTGVTDARAVKTDLRALLTDPARAWASSTTLSFIGTQQFNDATERWTVFSPPTYKAAISPETEEDVRKAIQLATSYNIPFLVTGQRHGYTTTLHGLKDGLAIDLSRMNSINVNAAAETVTIGPGVTAGDIFDPLYNAGFEIQTGSASCPSLIGVALGGGVGRFTGLYGLLIDALVSVRMVTASGQVIEVSEKSHSDLFWAIRGAGANFGAVTSATFKVHPLRNRGDVLSADFLFPAEKASQYFEAVEAFNHKLPAELASITIVMWNSSTNATQVGANWVYLGPEKEGRKVLAPLINLKPVYSNIQVVKWSRLVATAGGGVEMATCEDNLVRDLYSLNLRNYSASTAVSSLSKMSDFFSTYPGGRTSILQFEYFPNQAMAAVPLERTAWPWRQTTGYINPNMIWGPGDAVTQKAAQALGRELRDDFRATSGFEGPRVFVNYARGDETLEQIYSKQNLPRLSNLKKRWDPKNAFSFNNAIPSRYVPKH